MQHTEGGSVMGDEDDVLSDWSYSNMDDGAKRRLLSLIFVPAGQLWHTRPI